jgi:GPI inositol-deacylase, winged helix domain
LARLLTDQLLGSVTVAEMITTLDHLPIGLEEAFDSSRQRIDSRPNLCKALAYRVLGWITHAKRPLKVLEMVHAFAVKDNCDEIALGDNIKPETLLRVCVGLGTINTHDNSINMVHSTAHEYFRVKFDEEGYDELDVAKTCLQYLRMKPMVGGACHSAHQMTERLEKLPFLAYSSQYWGMHIINQNIEEQMREAILEFLDDGNFRSSSFQALQFQRP